MLNKFLIFIFILYAIKTFVMENKKSKKVHYEKNNEKGHDIDKILEDPHSMFDIDYNNNNGAKDDELPEEYKEFLDQMHSINFDHYKNEDLIQIGENQYVVPNGEI